MTRIPPAAAGALFILLLSSCVCTAAPFRAEKPLDAWRFQPGHGITTSPAANDWIDVKLPYTWTATWQHPKDGKDKSWAKLDLHGLDSAWFETAADVPADWDQKRVYLNLSGVQCDAIVWVNGQRLGEVKGPDGRVDITAAVAAGKPAKIRLWVTRWWDGTTEQRQQDILRDRTIRELARSQWFHSEDEAHRAIPAGISGGVSLQAVPREAAIDNVFVTTSYRRKELSLRVNYDRHTDDATQLRVQVAELDGGTAGLPAAVVPLSQNKSATEQVVTLPWQNPHLWEVGAGYLYQVHVSLLGAGNRTIDEYPPVRFGFREIWTEGKELILNGHPLRLRLPYFVTSVPEMIFFTGIGFNAMEMQPNPSAWYGTWGLFPGANTTQSGANLLDAADEHGWAVLMPAPGVNAVRSILGEPQVQQLYLHDFHTWLREADRQNRACILMWAPSMNTGSNYDPATLGRHPSSPPPAWYGEVEKLIKSVDPSRLVFHHSGGQTGDMQTQNCYLNFVPLQEREDYLSAWSRSGETPWAAIEHGPPTSVNFFKRATVPYFTEYAAIYDGDAAYAAEKDEYITASLHLPSPQAGRKSAFAGVEAFSKAGVLDHIGDWTAYYNFMDLFIRHTDKAWRGWGVNGGWLPWIFDVGFGNPPGEKLSHSGWHLYESLSGPDDKLKQRPSWANPIYDAYHDTMQPLLVFLGGPADRFTEKDHDFYAGDAFEKSIVAVWDGPGSRRLTASWELSSGGKAVSSGTERFALAPGAIEKRPLRLTAPAVTTRTAALLTLVVRDETGKAVAHDQLDLTFFPRLAALAPLTAHWAIYDPVGKTTADLTRLGLRPRKIVPGDDLSAVDVLIVGYKALSQTGKLPFTAADIARGLRVVCFEQDIASLEAMGFRVQDVIPRYVFPRVAGSPLLDGITPAGLRNWRGAGSLLPATSAGMKVWPWPHGPHWGNTGSVASVVIETPHRGAFTPILDCEFDLAYSPLLQWRHGRGEVIFCQLDVTDRSGLEPAAGILTRNLIRYLDAKPATVQNREILMPDGDSSAAFVQALGMRCGTVAANQLSKPAPGADLIVLGPDDVQRLSPQLSQLRSWVRSGGTVVVLPQTASDLTTAALPWPLHTEAAKLARVTPDATDAAADILRGVGPQLLHWRTFLDLNRFTAQDLPANSRRLLGGLLLEVPDDSGKWLFSQLDWRPLSGGGDYLRRANWNMRKFYRQLFTNLGAETDPAVAEQLLSPRRYAPMVNVSLWQVLNQPLNIDPASGPNNSLPALSASLPPEEWVANPLPAKRRDFEWRLRGADKNGYLDLSRIAPAKLGQIGYAVTYVYSSVARDASFALSSDWWFVFKVNGKVCVDQGKNGRIPHAPAPGEVRIRVPLIKGWNRLEMKVASGSAGFGFWCQVTDPGDLRVAPAVTSPDTLPAHVVAPTELLQEPLVTGHELLYTEPLLKEDDPYGFTPW